MDIRLINRKIEELADADLHWADLLMGDGTRICAASRSAPGGHDMLSSPHMYAAADFQVTGQAEDIIKHFVVAW